MTNDRVEWIDIAKFIGIFTIYLGHFGEAAGLAYQFVFQFHVALFFFISGCMNNYDREKNIWNYCIKKMKSIMLPFYGFAVFSVFLNVIINNMGMREIMSDILLVVKGCIRNSFFAGSLWFLSCLFIMEVVFKLIKYLKYRMLIITVPIIFFVVAELIISPRPIFQPHLLYNVDSMLYFMVFFAVGYCIYPYVAMLLELDTKLKKVIFCVLFLMTAIYTGFLFEGKSILKIISFNTFTKIFTSIMQPIIVITFVLLVSRLLVGMKVLSKIGKDTLFLCGNEWIIKTVLPMLLSMIGLTVNISNPLVAYIYTFILILINVNCIIPIEKKIIYVLGNNLINRNK